MPRHAKEKSKRILKMVYNWCVDNDIPPTIIHQNLGERIYDLFYRLKNEEIEKDDS